jgi:hypothetical protein
MPGEAAGARDAIGFLSARTRHAPEPACATGSRSPPGWPRCRWSIRRSSGALTIDQAADIAAAVSEHPEAEAELVALAGTATRRQLKARCVEILAEGEGAEEQHRRAGPNGRRRATSVATASGGCRSAADHRRRLRRQGARLLPDPDLRRGAPPGRPRTLRRLPGRRARGHGPSRHGRRLPGTCAHDSRAATTRRRGRQAPVSRAAARRAQLVDPTRHRRHRPPHHVPHRRPGRRRDLPGPRCRPGPRVGGAPPARRRPHHQGRRHQGPRHHRSRHPHPLHQRRPPPRRAGRQRPHLRRAHLRQPRFLELDHEWEYHKGGPTSYDNLRPLCSFHHRQRTTEATSCGAPPAATSGSPPTEPSSPPSNQPPRLTSASHHTTSPDFPPAP